jgi:hypothetical protein
MKLAWELYFVFIYVIATMVQNMAYRRGGDLARQSIVTATFVKKRKKVKDSKIYLFLNIYALCL